MDGLNFALIILFKEFNEKSPKNHRDGIDDIILLFTDGRPNPDFTTEEHKDRKNKKADQTKPADKASKTLKENNVTIIGLAGGKEENIRDFRSYIKRWSSPNQVFESKLDELPNLIDQLVEDFCKTGTKPCGCEGNSSTVQYVQDSESKLFINWKKPSLNCGDGVFVPEPKVHPEGTESPKEFGIGRHEITYTFSPSSGGKNRPSVECSVGVNIDLCFCPSPRVVSAVIPLGDSRAFAEWSEPTPLGECKFVPSPFNPQSSGWFRAGRHELTYDYTHTTELHSYTMHCPVTIYVKETKPCVCEGTSSTVQYVQDSESKVLINWEKPRLNCGDGVVVPEPKVHPERAESPMEFGPGRYKITYKFSPSSGGKKRPSVECSVGVNIDLCFCPSPQVVNVEVTPGESTAFAKWSEPTPLGDCEFVPSPSNPREPSGRFRAGRHELTYAYKHTTEMHSYTMHCPVTIYVKGQFCGAIAFNPETQICCCGKVREIAFGDMCCGQENYVLHEKTCCPGDKLVLNEEECS
ncbi:uncharacterized protein LOC114526850 [Dendronephthya gigantea]|uniref:uncharacterized protein LOC114526850 n=1 Tax=Dendronephthya gigantea TaxID=151771 RepID=UPI00106A3C19|nr:uncharacterized protein LOC114526850 [Dendronephthya gigantea]